MKSKQIAHFSPQNFCHKMEITCAPIDKKVAIIGGGVAGLAAARQLKHLACGDIEIFEKKDNTGGQMRHSIPHWRAVDELLDQQLDFLKNQKIKIRFNYPVHKRNIQDIVEKFDAVLVATGCGKPRKMGIEGEELAIPGIRFLEKNRKKQLENLDRQKVTILGGGNTAIDALIASAKLGAKPYLVYRRTQKEMPAFSHQIDTAGEYGIKFNFLLSPQKIEKIGPQLKLTFWKTKTGQKDESGRSKFIVTDEEVSFFADKVISAVGEIADTSFLDDIESPKIFMSGDAKYGAKDIASAVFDGRQTALEINSFLRGEKCKQEIFAGEKVCYDCGICVVTCPTRAISKVKKAKYEVEKEKCIRCKACIRRCPGAVWEVR